MLAEEADRLNVGGGEGRRGGLLVKAPVRNNPSLNLKLNLIQILAHNGSIVFSNYDSMCLTAMKRLRQSNLLMKEDIKHFNLHLLPVACTPTCKARFEYLVDWDPTSLMFHYKGDICLHWAVKSKNLGAESFARHGAPGRTQALSGGTGLIICKEPQW